MADVVNRYSNHRGTRLRGFATAAWQARDTEVSQRTAVFLDMDDEILNL